MKMQMEFRSKNVEFLTSRMFASSMIRVFPSLEHSGGACPHSARQFVGLLCSTYLCSRKKHNRAKPMSELPSAMFLIADDNEFRFARFYIVYEGVQLVRPESPPIVSGVSDMHPSDCPNVEETRNPMQTFSWKKCSHFSPTNIPSAFPSEIPRYDLLIILLINIRYVYCDNSFLCRNRYL